MKVFKRIKRNCEIFLFHTNVIQPNQPFQISIEILKCILKYAKHYVFGQLIYISSTRNMF